MSVMTIMVVSNYFNHGLLNTLLYLVKAEQSYCVFYFVILCIATSSSGCVLKVLGVIPFKTWTVVCPPPKRFLDAPIDRQNAVHPVTCLL